MTLHVYGANSKRKMRAAFQPLSVVELTYDVNPTRVVPVVSTIEPLYLPERVYADIRRQSVALFVTEMLMLTLTHPMQDERMYEFIDAFVHELNDNPVPENLHILFMLRLAELLGIGTPDVGGHLSDKDSAITALSLSRTQRRQLLHRLCDYYLEHVESFRQPKSLDILTEVFD